MSDTVQPVSLAPVSLVQATVVATPAPAPNPTLTPGRIRFRRLSYAALKTFALAEGEPGFATDTLALMIGSKTGNVVFTPYDPAPMLQRIIALEYQVSQQFAQINQQSQQITSLLAQINTLGEKVMSFAPATPTVPVAVPETGTATLTRPASATTYEVDTTGGAVTLTLYAATGSNLPIVIDNTKGTANVTVVASGTDTFDTPMPAIVPGASNTLRDYASGKWVVN